MKWHTWMGGALAMLACLAGAAWAEAPEAMIMGPDEVRAGDLVVLQTEGSTGDAFEWTVLPEEAWKGRYFVGDGGRTLVFASRDEGRLTAVLSVAGVDSDGNASVDVAVHTVTNGDGDAEPEPEPEPDPTPPTPDLAEWVTTTFSATVTSSSKQQLARTLAETIRTVSSQAAAGTIETPRQFREAIRAANRAAMSATDGDALSAFVVRLDERLDALSAAGSLGTLEQYRAIYAEIAAGLEAVK